ncbi:unnamed protein product [Danaus chrysippus]|uniref:(African queen) hypothetical protein n=1 Tax=Danaus chrysippus TaxID=151541 RepID=A0A8J2QJB1_9NEOP|nr:unnamed protein product [Danaus chrysippus]
MADGNVIFGRKLLKKFIQMYKELPCLWDRSCVTYKHKKKRHDAIGKLTELVQQYDRSATRLHVLRKIESMRACVRRAHRRVLQSRVQATNPDEIYTPNLWYYNMLSFVLGEEGNSDEIKDSTEPDADESPHQKHEDVDVEDEVGYQEYALPTNMMEGNSLIQKYDYEDEKSKRYCTEVEDEYDAIGINVAAKLRGLPPNMRILAEKLINDVLYQAQMNNLGSSTVINTPDPIKQDIK